MVEELTITPVLDDTGQPTHHVVEVWDVSRVHALEWAITQAGRERAAVSAALMHLDVHDTMDATADAIASELMLLPGVDAAAIMAFDLPSGGHVLAARGMPGMVRGTQASEETVGFLRDRVVMGPFAEPWAPGHPHSRTDDPGRALVAIASGPIVADGRLVGVLALGTADPAQRQHLLDDLTTVGEFSAIASVLLGGSMRAEQERSLARRHIDRIITEQRFEIVYQPIVDLASGRRVGYEALTRFLDTEGTEPIGQVAETVGRGRELDATVIEAAIAGARDLPAGAWLGIDISPASLAAMPLQDLSTAAGRLMILELSEHHMIDDYAPLRAALGALGDTVQLAIDDTGAGAANLAHLVELRPRYVKLDASLIHDVERDLTRQAMTRGILQFANAVGSEVIAVGVKTSAELDALRRLGVGLAQGQLLGRPAGASAWSESQRTNA